MRERRVVGLVGLVLACALAVGAPAYAVGVGNPVIESPAPGAAHYAGYTGPFTVSFEYAPPGDYRWFVDRIPAGGGTPVAVTAPQTYTWTGSGAKPQFRTAALAAADGYRFRVTDNAGHEATLPFRVLPGPAPACAIVVPARVRVNAPVERITGRLTTTCARLHTDWAAWKVQHVRAGFADLYYFDGRSTDTWTYYDDEPTGTYTITPNGARSTDFEDVPQNTRRTVVRRDARLAVTGTRTGAVVVVRAALRRYLPRVNGFRTWAGRAVSVAARSCDSCAWHHLRTVRTDVHGTVSIRVRAPRARLYRVVAGGSPEVWAPAARYLRR